MSRISPHAVIHPSAQIASDVEVGPYTLIGPGVEIGAGTRIASHAVIVRDTKIGKNNQIFSYTAIGEDPQARSYHGETTYLEIGDNNIIREFCTIHRGTPQGGGVTKIGHDNFLMAYAHVAHDCIVGNHIIFTNNASIAGHVSVEDYAILGAFVGVHQFCRVGKYSFISTACAVTKDVLPYVLVWGRVPEVRGLNVVGLKRHNFGAEIIDGIKKAYRVIFRRGLTVQDAVGELKQIAAEFQPVQLMLDALQASKRGIVR